jgi:hypothetical protein
MRWEWSGREELTPRNQRRRDPQRTPKRSLRDPCRALSRASGWTIDGARPGLPRGRAGRNKVIGLPMLRDLLLSALLTAIVLAPTGATVFLERKWRDGALAGD